ncbi:hypothetical protein AwErysi_05260 [Erysipelotrichaceae bacterium]|nr:hypothetical protein AwErysi_05260 [Erysipelotrichaceae bacterium]
MNLKNGQFIVFITLLSLVTLLTGFLLQNNGYQNSASTEIRLVYDVYQGEKKMGTLGNIEKFKSYIATNIETKYGVIDGLYFGENLVIEGRYQNEEELLGNQEQLYQEIWNTQEFTMDALKLKVIQDNGVENDYIVRNTEIWSNAIEKVKHVTGSKVGEADTSYSIDLNGQVEREKVRVQLEEVLTEQQVVHKIMAPTGLTHEIVQGETVQNIAIQTGSIIEELELLNPMLKADSILVPGSEIFIADTQYDLAFSKIEIEEVEEPLLYDIEYVDDENLYQGKSTVLEAGEDGVQRIQYIFKYSSTGEKVYLSEEQLEVIKPAKKAVIQRGVKEATHIGSGIFIWPSQSRRVSAEYMDPTYGFGPHYGMDINDKLNGDIYAADNGTVVSATYNSSYGNHIIIDHNNGYWTLYAHLNKINVREGEVVESGDVIGGMGTTGLSTGIHLHFEIRVGSNDRSSAVNPRQYID